MLHDASLPAWLRVIGFFRWSCALNAFRLGILFSTAAEMAALGRGEHEAYRPLRGGAMRQRLTLEQCAAALLAAGRDRRA